MHSICASFEHRILLLCIVLKLIYQEPLRPAVHARATAATRSLPLIPPPSPLPLPPSPFPPPPSPKTPTPLQYVSFIVVKIKAKDEGVESRKRTMTLEHMERYAREGLRTLLVASAELDQDWFFQWNKK